MLLFFASSFAAHAETQPVEVRQFLVERNSDGIFLSAAIKFELPSVVEDAMQKGVAMFFVAEADVTRDRWYWTDKTIISVRRHIRISYQPVTRRWRLNVSTGVITNNSLSSSFNQTFDTLSDAMASLQRLSRWRIGEPSDIETEQKYKVEFRFALDLTQLPRPFQIGVLGQSDWIIAASFSQRLPVESFK